VQWDDLRVFLAIIELSDTELERAANTIQMSNLPRRCLGARVANFRLQALDAFWNWHSWRDVMG